MGRSNVTAEINRILTLEDTPTTDFTPELFTTVNDLIEDGQKLMDTVEMTENKLNETKRDLISLSEQITEMSRKQGQMNASLYDKNESKESESAYKPEEVRNLLQRFGNLPRPTKGGGL